MEYDFEAQIEEYESKLEELEEGSEEYEKLVEVINFLKMLYESVKK